MDSEPCGCGSSVSLSPVLLVLVAFAEWCFMVEVFGLGLFVVFSKLWLCLLLVRIVLGVASIWCC